MIQKIRDMRERLKNFIISRYGTIPRTVLVWTNFIMLTFSIAYIISIVSYIPLFLLESLYPEHSVITEASRIVDTYVVNYIFSFPQMFIILGLLLVLSLPTIIWRLLFRTNELASTFLNNAVKEIENLDINDNEKKLRILKNISYFKDFAYTVSPVLNPYSIPILLRLGVSLPLPLQRNKLVVASFEKRIQFISNKLDELIPVIALSKDEKKLEEVAEEIKRFSVILREENYLNLEEAELKRSYLPDIFDWKTIVTVGVITIIALGKDLLLEYFQRL